MIPQTASTAPYPQTPAPVGKPKGMVGIWIGILCIVAGIVLGIVLIVVGARSFVDSFGDLERVPIAVGGTVNITETGTQTIFAERPTTDPGTNFSTGNTFSGYGPDITLEVIDPNGDEVFVSTSGATTTYTHNRREGRQIGTFQADQTGEYQINVASSGNLGQYTTLAVGEWFDASGLLGIVGGVVGGGALVLLGIILIIVFAVRRSRSKRRIAQARNPYGAGVYGAAPAAGVWPGAPGYPGAGGPNPGFAAPAQTWQPPAAPGWVPPPVAPAQPDAPVQPDVPPQPEAAPAGFPPPWQPPSQPMAPAPPWQPPGQAPTPPGEALAPPPPSPPPPSSPAPPPWEPPAAAPTTESTTPADPASGPAAPSDPPPAPPADEPQP